MIPFTYSLIKYMPSIARGEIINLGLVIFKHDGIDVRMLKNAQKAKIIDNKSKAEDLEKFKSLITKITESINDVEEQYKTLKLFSGNIYLSDRGTFTIQDHQQYNNIVENLFNTLIKSYSANEKIPRQSRLQTKLKNKLLGLDLLASDPEEINHHKVVANYVVGERTGITADFMLKNGKYHMTNVVDLNLNDASTKFKETSMKVMSFVEGKKILKNNVAAYFVYTASIEKEKEMQHHIRLAESYSDCMFNFESGSDQADYLALMQKYSGQVGLQ